MSKKINARESSCPLNTRQRLAKGWAFCAWLETGHTPLETGHASLETGHAPQVLGKAVHSSPLTYLDRPLLRGPTALYYKTPTVNDSDLVHLVFEKETMSSSYNYCAHTINLLG